MAKSAEPLAFAHEENFKFASTLTAAELAARGNGRFFTSWEEICEHQDTQIVPSRFPNITRTIDQGRLRYPNTTNLSYLHSSPARVDHRKVRCNEYDPNNDLRRLSLQR